MRIRVFTESPDDPIHASGSSGGTCGPGGTCQSKTGSCKASKSSDRRPRPNLLTKCAESSKGPCSPGLGPHAGDMPGVPLS